MTCSYKNLAQCDAVTGNALFYAMDGGEQLLTVLCGGQDANAAVAKAWNCPKYSSGITQLKAGLCVGGANNGQPCNVAADCPGGICGPAPIYPVVIGPVSDSVVSVPLPGGPGTAFNAIGDDYAFSNAVLCVGGTRNGLSCTVDTDCPGGRCGSFLALEAMRYVGYTISGGGRLSIDFYDSAGNFVEDVVTGGMATELGINVVTFAPPLTIPPSGWIVVHTASDLVPDMRFAMASTTATGMAGTNNAAAPFDAVKLGQQ